MARHLTSVFASPALPFVFALQRDGFELMAEGIAFAFGPAIG